MDLTKYGKTITAIVTVIVTVAGMYGIQISVPGACPEETIIKGDAE